LTITNGQGKKEPVTVYWEVKDLIIPKMHSKAGEAIEDTQAIPFLPVTSGNTLVDLDSTFAVDRIRAKWGYSLENIYILSLPSATLSSYSRPCLYANGIYNLVSSTSSDNAPILNLFLPTDLGFI
jgi:hypothetical protein